MNNSIFDKLSARKEQIIWVVLIVSIFYLISVWSVGSVISFMAFYYYGFGLLTKTLGINEWLARAILIPMVALLVFAISRMLSITSRKDRQDGTILTIVILTLFSLAAYYHTKDICLGHDHFSWFSGEPLKRYFEQNDFIEVYPKNTLFHPKTGVKLELLTPGKVAEFARTNEELVDMADNKEGNQRGQKDKYGNTRLFNERGRPNFRYHLTGGRMDLFPSRMALHPSSGQKLFLLSQQVLEKHKKQKREQVEKQFLARINVWSDTGYYVLRGDILDITEYGFPGTDLLIAIGESGPVKYLEFNSGNGRRRRIIAESDGLLQIAIGERNAEVKEVSIVGLSIRLYK